jgi:hypothetical protein
LKQTGYELSVNNKSSFNLADKFMLEANFFDEDGEAWTCKEVLEEILSFCNLTMVLVGEVAYIVDWDEVDNLVEAGDGIVYTGSTLSLSEVYNSISIESDTYAMESLVPTIGSDNTIITSAPTYFLGTLPDKHTEKIVTLKSDRIDTNVFNYKSSTLTSVEPKKDASNWNTNFGAFYFRPTYWNYEESNEGEASSECVIGFKNVWVDKDCEPFSDNYNGQQTNNKNDKYSGLYWAYSDSQKIGSTTTVLTMKSDGDVVVGGGYTCVEAECWSNCGNIPAAVASGSTVVTEIKQKSTDDAIKLKCSIKVGDWHLIYSNRNNATTKQNLYWTKDVPSEEFPLELEIGELGDDIQKFEQWHNLRNCQIEGVDSVGYKAYKEDIIVGELEVKFCLPKMKTMTSGNGDKYKQYHWVLMKSFAIKNIAKETFDDDKAGVTIGEEDNNDIVWSTIISDDYSVEGESISLKLNTPSNRSYCYSDVFHSTNGETFTRLETVDKGEGEYPAEQYKLNSYYWQNRVPRKVIDLVTDKVMNPIAKYKTPYSEMAFICNSLSIDYAEAKSTLQLIEKESL